ncbi:MAG: DUF1836 domain-containing protein [Christensenellales bacterium]
MQDKDKVKEYIIVLPRWDELPDISLYLEQVLELVNGNLEKYLEGDKNGRILTQTMVNNYVKHGFIKSPVKKRYDKTALASLIVIAVLKDIFTIKEISQLISLAIDASNPEESYNYFCQLVEETTENVLMQGEQNVLCSKKDPRGICSSAVMAFASKYYVNKVFLLKNEAK